MNLPKRKVGHCLVLGVVCAVLGWVWEIRWKKGTNSQADRRLHEASTRRMAVASRSMGPMVLSRASEIAPAPLTTAELDQREGSIKKAVMEVDRAFREWAEAHRRLGTPPSEAFLAEGLQRVRTRRERLSQWIEIDPEDALSLTIPYALRQGLPETVKAELEESLSFRGDLQVLAVTPAGTLGGALPTQRFVRSRTDGRVWQAWVYGRRLSQGSLLDVPLQGIAIGRRMALHSQSARLLEEGEPVPAEVIAGGFRFGDEDKGRVDPVCGVSGLPATSGVKALIEERAMPLCDTTHLGELHRTLAIEEDRAAPAAAPDWTVGTKRVLYIRVRFPEDSTNPLDDADSGALFGALKEFFRANSGGALEFEFTLTPLLTLPRTKSDYAGLGASGYLSVREDALEAVRGLNDPALVPEQFPLDCVRFAPVFTWFSGIATVGGKGCWLQTSAPSVAGHELGHNLGLMHANAWYQEVPEKLSSGRTQEYANPFDVMGTGMFPGSQFGANRKLQLGWMNPEQSVLISRSGVYRLVAHDAEGIPNPLARLLRVQRQNGSILSLELRSTKTSAGLRTSGPLIFIDDQLVDASPRSTDPTTDFEDASLAPGRIFADREDEIWIRCGERLGAEGDWVDVTVNIGRSDVPPFAGFTVEPKRIESKIGELIELKAISIDPLVSLDAVVWDLGNGLRAYGNEVRFSYNRNGERLVRAESMTLSGPSGTNWALVRVGNPRFAHHLEGRVTHLGKPLRTAEVHASGVRGFTDENGDYALAGLTNGIHEVTLVHPLVPFHRVISVQMAGESLRNVDFQLTGPEIAQVTLSALQDGARHPINQELELGVDLLLEPGATVRRVEYFNDAILIATGEAPTFAAKWVQPTEGEHSLKAVAHDEQGRVASSKVVRLTVVGGPPAEDSIETSVHLSGQVTRGRYHNINATRSTGELGKGDASVWYSWSATSSDLMEIRAELVLGGNLWVETYRQPLQGPLIPVGFHATNRALLQTVPGEKYLFRIGTDSADAGFFDLTVRAHPRPTNDDYTKRSFVDVVPGKTLIKGTLMGASREPNEPLHGGKVDGNSVWWGFTVPAVGVWEIVSDTPEIQFAIYDGEGSWPPTAVSARGSESVWFGTHGKTYALAAVERNVGSEDFAWQLVPVTRAWNDTLDTAFIAEGVAWEYEVPITKGTAGASEPVLISGTPPLPVVWWTWNPGTSTHRVRVRCTVVDSNARTAIAIYPVDNGVTGPVVVQSPDVGANQAVEFQPIPGVRYAIAVSTTHESAYRLRVHPINGNDYFDDATSISGETVVVTGTVGSATAEPGEPFTLLGVARHSRWWRWTAHKTEFMNVQLNSVAGASVDVFSGAELRSLVLASQAAGTPAVPAKAFLAATAGKNYWIRCEFLAPAESQFGLSIEPAFARPNSNDRFQNRTLVSGKSISLVANTQGATRQTQEGEPYHGGRVDGMSLWWEWVAPENGGYAVRAESASAVFLGVYEYDWAEDLAALGAVAADVGVTATAGFHAEKGRSYFIVLDQPVGKSSPVRFSLGKGPENDDFQEATSLGGDDLNVPIGFTGASLELDERPHGTTDELGSVWYRWMAPASGGFLLEMIGSNGPYSIAAYTGTSLTNLARFSVETVQNSRGARTVLAATEGTLYHIAITRPGGTSAPAELRIRRAPENDAFGRRREIVESSLPLVEDAAGGTLEIGEPPHSMKPFGASLWYGWTAPSTGGVVFKTGDLPGPVTTPAHSELAALRVAAYVGSQLNTLYRVAQSDRGTLTFRATEGTRYAIAISDPQSVGTAYQLQILRAPPNDDFETRVALDSSAFTVVGSLLGSTLETQEPALAPNQTASLWWEWTAPASGGQSLLSRSPGSSVRVEVFEGKRLDALVPVTEYHFAQDRVDQTAFRSVAGRAYQIRVSTDDPLLGSFELQLAPAPINDDWTQAGTQTGLPLEIRGSLLGATRESLDSSAVPGESGTVWYRWTAPDTRPVAVSVLGEDGGWVLRVYDGDGPNRLRLLGSDVVEDRQRPAVVRLEAQRGATYSIAISRLGGVTGRFIGRVDGMLVGDDSSAPWILDNPTGSFVQSFARSTVSSDEARFQSEANAGSVWFLWKPIRSGGYSIRASLTNAPAILVVHGGMAPRPGTIVARAVAGSDRDAARTAVRVESGLEYLIEVASDRGVFGEVRVEIQPSELNDDFENAAELGCCSFSSLGLTREPGEPDSPWGETVGTQWWKWTAPKEGLAVLTGTAAGAVFGVTVYEGDELSQLKLVAHSRGSNRVNVRFDAISGKTYYAAGEFTNDSPALRMSTEISRTPVNDLFSARQALLVLGVATVSSSTVGAQREPGEPLHRGTENGGSLWYSWKAPASGVYQVGLTASVSETAMVSLYQGTNLSALTPVVSKGPSRFSSDRTTLVFNAIQGQDYLIAVEDSPENAGPFALSIQPKPINDDFDDRLILKGSTISVNTRALGATSEIVPGGYPLRNSIWYSWTSPADGYVTASISVVASSLKAAANLYYVDLLGRLTYLGTGNANPMNVEFFSSANTEYVFEVTTASPDSSNIRVEIGFDDLGGVNFLSDGFWARSPASGPFNWVVGPVAPWFTDTSSVMNLPDAARSSPSVLGMSWMETMVEGPGTLKFWWKVSCHPTEAFLGFYNRSLPGGEAPLLRISGERGWQPVTVPIPAGRNLIRWGYTRRTVSGIQGRDAGWVDQLEILPEHSDESRFGHPVLSSDGEFFQATLSTSPGRLTELQVSDDLVQWQSWFSTLSVGESLTLPAIAISNRPSLFLRAQTR